MMQSKKQRLFMLCLTGCLIISLLSGCSCRHKWTAATCTDPQICQKCGETMGDALGHDWQDATCTLAVTCERCGQTKGEPLGHEWAEATCTDPKTCLRCGEELGDALGHEWLDATCTDPMTCSVCGTTNGEPLGHSVEEWIVDVEATCAENGTQYGVCSVCEEDVEEIIPATGEHEWDDGEVTLDATCEEDGIIVYECIVCGMTKEETIEPTGHTPGDWVVTVPAQSSSKGTREIQCVDCGKTLETETYEMSDEEKEAAFKDECITYDYETIARSPDDYLLEKVHFRGEVIQVLEDGNDYTLRVNVTEGKYSWTDTILVEYTKNSNSESRILEDDIIDLYGLCMGTVTYESIFGQSITIPAVIASYIDIN